MRAGLICTVLTAIALVLPAQAQTLRGNTGPANLPPDSFAGAQFVDSRGCVYLRAGTGARVQWVPRVTRDRRIVCGQVPTFGGDAVGTGPAPPPPVSTRATASVRPSAPGLRVTVETSGPGRGAVLRIEGAAPPVPPGYRPVFTDGRHNPQRGLPPGAVLAGTPLLR